MAGKVKSVFLELEDGTMLHAFSYGQRFGPRRLLTLEAWRWGNKALPQDPLDLWLILNCWPRQHRGIALSLLDGTMPREMAFDYLKEHGEDQLMKG